MNFSKYQLKTTSKAKTYMAVPAPGNKGSVMIIVVFAIALLAALVCGIVQVNTEEIQLMHNQVSAAEATEIAGAGLSDAIAQIRSSRDWTAGFAGKSFAGGSYTVTVSGTLPCRTIVSTGVSSEGFISRLAADMTVGNTSPYIVRIDRLRINE